MSIIVQMTEGKNTEAQRNVEPTIVLTGSLSCKLMPLVF